MLQDTYASDLYGKESKDDSSTISSLKNKRFLLVLAHDLERKKLEPLPAAPPQGADLHAIKRHEYQETIDAYKETIDIVSKQIEDSTKLIKQFKGIQDFPQLGTHNDLDLQQLRVSVPLFDPDFSKDQSFETFWRKLISFGESKQLNEKMFIMALSNLLQGEAYEIYYMKRDKPLKELIEALYDSYHDSSTWLDKQEKLDNMKRTKGQTIGNFMGLVHTLALQAIALRTSDEVERKGIVTAILTDKLRQNCSTGAKSAINKEMAKSLKEGHIMTFEEMLAIARETEHCEQMSQ